LLLLGIYVLSKAFPGPIRLRRHRGMSENSPCSAALRMQRAAEAGGLVTSTLVGLNDPRTTLVRFLQVLSNARGATVLRLVENNTRHYCRPGVCGSFATPFAAVLCQRLHAEHC
jgi:hypothetical protein